MTGAYAIDLGLLGDWPSLNDLRHWARLKPQMENVRHITWAEAKNAGVPRDLGPVEIELVLHLTDQHRQDPDNLGLVLKAAIDGLRLAGVLADDGHSHVTRAGSRIVPSSPPRRWVLHITEPTDAKEAS